MTIITKNMSVNLVWITVADFDKAVKYYTEKLGLELLERYDDLGWAEVKGEGGAILGIAKASDEFKPGMNAVVSFSVDDIESTKQDLVAQGVTFVGETMEVPGHVKLQLCRDPDGNFYHLAERLD